MRHLGILLVIGLVGCGQVDCANGFEERDGACHAVPDDDDEDDTATTPEPASIVDVLDGVLPKCSLLAPESDSEIDLRSGCAGPGCIGDTAAELEAAYGEPPDCDSASSGYLWCGWGVWDLGGWFYDGDGDGVPDPDARVDELFLTEAFPGRTRDGLSAGISGRCFVEELGEPDYLLVEHEGLVREARLGRVRPHDRRLRGRERRDARRGRRGVADPQHPVVTERTRSQVTSTQPSPLNVVSSRATSRIPSRSATRIDAALRRSAVAWTRSTPRLANRCATSAPTASVASPRPWWAGSRV